MGIRFALCSALAVLATGCATNPMQGASFWHMDQCAKSLTTSVRLNIPGVATPVFVPRSSCQAVVSAGSNVERVASYNVDRILLASIEEVNAFATRDNNQRPVLIVSLGMLKALGHDEDAWAGLLGHEIAHHVRAHGRGRDEARATARGAGQAVGNVLAQLIPGVGGFVAGNASSFLVANAAYGAYTRPQEEEADSLGLEWMVAAGYDPSGMERLFVVLSRQSSGMPAFLSTHPGADDRAEKVRNYVASNPVSRTSPPQKRDYVSNQTTTPIGSGNISAAQECVIATAPLRLQTLCVTGDGCQREFEAIGQLCKQGKSEDCRNAQSNVLAQCVRTSKSYSPELCELAARAVTTSCGETDR